VLTIKTVGLSECEVAHTEQKISPPRSTGTSTALSVGHCPCYPLAQMLSRRLLTILRRRRGGERDEPYQSEPFRRRILGAVKCQIESCHRVNSFLRSF
jgi:hypothetical protein